LFFSQLQAKAEAFARTALGNASAGSLGGAEGGGPGEGKGRGDAVPEPGEVCRAKHISLVLAPFFDTCQGRRCYEEKVADLKETITCTGSGLADGLVTDGPGEYSMKMLIRAGR